MINRQKSTEVVGKKYRFINGVGYGIDGYRFEVGDRLKKQGKPVNYTNIAIKVLLFDYRPTAAKVTVDGVVHSYKKVWIATTMHDRFYGGGMRIPLCGILPSEDRKVYFMKAEQLYVSIPRAAIPIAQRVALSSNPTFSSP